MFKPDLKSEKFPDLLKVAAVYGPNASGKSNLLKAMDVVWQIVHREARPQGSPLPVSPFCFDAALAGEPSVFETHFIQEGVRYQFNLAATSRRITSEKLVAFPKGRESLLYEREYTGAGDSYRFGALLEDSPVGVILENWKKLTSPQMLFIAQAIANSSEVENPLKAPFEWLIDGNRVLFHSMEQMSDAARRLASDGETVRDSIVRFLSEVDVPISKMRVETFSIPESRDLDSPSIESDAKNTRTGTKTTFTHKTALGEAELGYEDESEGTKNLIGFWLPWFTKRYRNLLAVDEIDSSLHPKIVAALVEQHILSELPTQLIFTTHDTHLMDTKLLRRDQFWITERDINGATQLRSIYDFEGRESDDLEKRYYEGRYRGLPLVKRR